MSKPLDLLGKTFGNLEVVSREANSNQGKSKWLCNCACGNTKVIQGNHLKNGDIKSCGCILKQKIQERATKRKLDAQVDFTCKHCKKTKKVKMSYTKNRKFCSKKCYEDYRYTGIALPENRAMRQTKEYRDWRKAVFMRDYYTCQKCESKGGELRAHHIKSFTKYEELRFSVKNGVTLCKSCHNKFHKLYGIIDFTATDYFEWLL